MTYKVLVLVIVLLALPFSPQADSVYDATMVDSAHVSVDAITWDYLTAVTWDSIDTTCLWNPEPTKRDTTTHYVIRIDSSWVVGKVVCDTTPVNFKTVDDTVWAERLDIGCDTTYRQRHTFVWAPLVTVKLRPEQIEKLRELLK